MVGDVDTQRLYREICVIVAVVIVGIAMIVVALSLLLMGVLYGWMEWLGFWRALLASVTGLSVLYGLIVVLTRWKHPTIARRTCGSGGAHTTPPTSLPPCSALRIQHGSVRK
jgi:hypothetical protein